MLNNCAECTTAYAPDLALCPHCGSRDLGDELPATGFDTETVTVPVTQPEEPREDTDDDHRSDLSL